MQNKKSKKNINRSKLLFIIFGIAITLILISILYIYDTKLKKYYKIISYDDGFSIASVPKMVSGPIFSGGEKTPLGYVSLNIEPNSIKDIGQLNNGTIFINFENFSVKISRPLTFDILWKEYISNLDDLVAASFANEFSEEQLPKKYAYIFKARDTYLRTSDFDWCRRAVFSYTSNFSKLLFMKKSKFEDYYNMINFKRTTLGTNQNIIIFNNDTINALFFLGAPEQGNRRALIWSKKINVFHVLDINLTSEHIQKNIDEEIYNVLSSIEYLYEKTPTLEDWRTPIDEALKKLPSHK
ncbi:hypothetical protein ACFL02_06025 [Planctomycetota bacterium]